MCNVQVVTYEFSVVASKAEELSNFLGVISLGLLSYSLREGWTFHLLGALNNGSVL